MNRTSRRSHARQGYYSRYLIHYTKQQYGLLLLAGLFLTGVILGTLLLKNIQGDALQLLVRMVGGFVEARAEKSLLDNFLSGLSSLLFVLGLFICGFSAISQPIAVLLPLFRGMGCGLSMALLYATHGTSAIGFVAVLMLPGTVMTTIALLLCCRESLRLSMSFFYALRGKEQSFYPLHIYLARYVSCAILCAAAAFLEAILYSGFANSLIIR